MKKENKGKSTPAIVTADPSAIKAKGEVLTIVQPIALSTRLETFTKELSPADSRNLRVATDAIVALVTSAAQNMMAFGDKLSELRAELGAPKFWRYVREVLVASRITSESNADLWMGRATLLRARIPNETLRTKLLTIGGGQGLVTRFEPTEEEKTNGAKSRYDISPFFQKALAEVAAPKGKLTDEGAELYARQLLDASNKARSAARVPDDARDADASKARLIKGFSAHLKRFGTGNSGAILYALFAQYCKVAKQKDAEALIGKLDKMLSVAVESGNIGEDAAAASVPATAPKQAAKTA